MSMGQQELDAIATAIVGSDKVLLDSIGTIQASVQQIVDALKNAGTGTPVDLTPQINVLTQVNTDLQGASTSLQAANKAIQDAINPQPPTQ